MAGWTAQNTRASVGRNIPRPPALLSPLKLITKVTNVVAKGVPGVVIEGESLGSGALRVQIGSEASVYIDLGRGLYGVYELNV